MSWTPKEAREGLTSVLDFATEFNDFVSSLAGFRPFGKLRGYKGRKKPLPKATTRWILRGMGIPQNTKKS